MTSELVVGFDLDFTLIDPRPAVRMALRQLGIADALVELPGSPPERWLPAGTGLEQYVNMYLRGAGLVTAMAGAAEAIAAVRGAGGRVVVVTAQRRDLAAACLAGAGLVVDELHASLWGTAKAAALTEVGAGFYVGHHPRDLAAAKLAGAYGIRVRTGPRARDGSDGTASADGTDGTPGADGTASADGTDGTPGADGTASADGTDGTPGADGPASVDGTDGTPGADGPASVDGTDGRDGTHGPASADGADVDIADLSQFPTAWAGGRLERRVRSLGSVLVAFSGGADSALVLAAAARGLGPRHVVAATAVSPSLPRAELAAARAFATSLGVRHIAPSTDELSREGYRANAGDRCYFCKSELIDTLLPLARSWGMAAVATGTNADDALAGFRPGIRAAAERGAVAPLREAGLTKADVRDISRQWGLRTWDKPAAACLSSRIAYGIQVTEAGLARVERAEAALRTGLAAAGHRVVNLRVRDLGNDVASIEVDQALIPAAMTLVSAVVDFTDVRVDPRGFRSGSMNELLHSAGPAR